MIHRVAGLLAGGRLTRAAAVPQPAPHGLDGGDGRRRPQARPGEICLAHHGVLFLDELPEFPRARCWSRCASRSRPATWSSRAPTPTSRYPAPLPAGRGDEPLPLRLPRRPGARLRAGRRAAVPTTWRRISGPLLDRIDLQRRGAAGDRRGLALPGAGEASASDRRPGRPGPRRPSASASPGTRASTGQRRRRGRPARSHRRADRRPARSSPTSPRSAASAPAATTGCCAWRGPSPTSKARSPSSGAHVAEAAGYRLAN